MKHLSQTLKMGLAALLILVAQAIMPAQAAFADGDGQLKQVFCNREGESGKWKAQIGGQSTEHEYPLLANDQYVYVHDQNDVTDDMDAQCQTLYGTQTIPIPATPAIDDPCGPRNARWILPIDTISIHWSLTGQNHLVATAQVGYIFSDRTTSHDFGVAVDANADCVIDTPQATIHDPCGLNNATWTVTSGSYYTVKQNSNRSVTVTANTGYTFAGGVKSYTIPAPADSGALCLSEPIPTPQPVDPCGLNNAYWVKPRNTQTVHWSINAKGELIATAIGVNFTNGMSSINFGPAQDSGALCQIDIPKQPQPNDPCGVNNASWELPRNTSAYTWSLSDGHLIVTTTANYTFGDGMTSYDFGVAPDSGQLCPVTITQPTCESDGSMTLTLPDHRFVRYYYEVTIGIAPPVKYTEDTTITGIKQGAIVHVKLVRDGHFIDLIFKKDYTFDMLSCIEIPDDPSPIDPCGPRNAMWSKPADTDTVTWSIVDGKLIATAVGSLFTDGKSTHNYGVAQDSNVLCAPIPPQVSVFCGLYNNDQLVLPEHDEFSLFSWSYYWEGNTLLVQAIADEGYSFDETTQTQWQFTDEHTPCSMPELTVTPKTCLANAAVTIVYDTDRYHYTIQLGDGEEMALDSGTTTLTEAGTYTIRGYEYRLGNDERKIVEESDGLVFTETFTVTVPNCEYGKGSLTPLPSPIELPQTGSDGITGWIVAILSAATVYGAVYFAQPRRP